MQQESNTTPPLPTGKTTPEYHAFLAEVIECPCGVPHTGKHIEAMRQDALGRMHLWRWHLRHLVVD